MTQKRLIATSGGLVALAIWSTTVGIVRDVCESLGVVTGPMIAMLAGGAAALAISWMRGVGLRSMLPMPRRYLLGCGAMFVAYEVCFLTAMGLAPDRSTVLVVGLVNYLWSVIMVALSVPILGRKARWPLVLGCLAAAGGMAVAVIGTMRPEWRELRESGVGLVLPLALAAAGAVLWGAFSNFARRWGPARASDSAVPLFLLASGVALVVLRVFRHEHSVWTAKAIGELAVLALAQSAIAYVLWETGLRRGNQLMLGLVSYFLPIVATGVTALYLHVRPGAGLIVGCVLVTAGALICRVSIVERDDERR